jgi:hypothetical protein
MLQAVPGSKPQDYGFDTFQVSWTGGYRRPGPGDPDDRWARDNYIIAQDPALRFLLAFTPDLDGPPFTAGPSPLWYWRWASELYRLRRKYDGRLTGVRWNHEYRPTAFQGTIDPLARQCQVIARLHTLQRWLCPGLDFWIYPAGAVSNHSPRQLPEAEYTLPLSVLDDQRIVKEAGFWHTRSPGWREELRRNTEPGQNRAWTVQVDRSGPIDLDQWQRCLEWVASQDEAKSRLGLWSEWTPAKKDETPSQMIRAMLERWKRMFG